MDTQGTISSRHAYSGFDPKNAGLWDYRPDHRQLVDEALQLANSGRIKPAVRDGKKVHLLVIDNQKDFCLKEGSLYVGGRSGTGAIDDSARMAGWIYENLSVISRITCTLDTHVPFQIFSRSFWKKEDGTPVDAFTLITAEDVRQGKYQLNLAAAGAIGADYNSLKQYVLHYCEELERKGKYTLYIWPEHCLLGTAGHNLVGVIEEASLFHSYARSMQADFAVKGAHPLTENYSVLSPEVLTDQKGQSFAQKNVKIIETLLQADYVIIGGQAASHCVASSIDDFLSEILAKDPALARKVYVVDDFMSSVTVPDGNGGFLADFTPNAEKALKRFSDHGMHVVSSTTPIDKWEDFVL